MAKVKGIVVNQLGKSDLEVRLTREVYLACSHQGDCEEDCRHWLKRLWDHFKDLTPEFVKSLLKPYGAWEDSELQDHELNLVRVLWLAAGNCRDENSCWTYLAAY